MNQYETVFILTPVLSDVQMKEAVEKFKGILAAEGAEIINEENWGLKKLAYPIEKKSTGFYQFWVPMYPQVRRATFILDWSRLPQWGHSHTSLPSSSTMSISPSKPQTWQ